MPFEGGDDNFEQFIKNLDDDDEFFHITCHISATLRAKIARGEYIDLEQLLPKDRNAAGLMSNAGSKNRVELVTSGGHTYFKPVKDTQITGLRK